MADVDSPEAGNNPDERPSWLPDNFESPEALAESYRQAQDKIREQGTQLNALNENYSMLSQQIDQMQEQQTQPQVDPQDAQAQMYAMYENDPVGTMALIAAQAARNETQQFASQQQQQLAPTQQVNQSLVAYVATEQLKSKYGDFDAERQRISVEIESNPLFRNEQIWSDPTTATAALEQAYTIVKGRDLIEGNIPAAGFDASAMKRGAQTATGSNPRPEPAQVNPWDAVKNANVGSYSDLMTRGQ